MRMFWQISWLVGLVVLLATWPVLAQSNPKNIVRNKIDQSVEEHNQQLEEAMGDKPTAPAPATPTVAPAAAAIKSGWITRAAKSAPDTKVRLYFAYPEGRGAAPKLPGLIVIQEWWGVNDDIQERTRDFAAKGFYAVAVDLYDGQSTDDPTKAASLRKAMTDEGALLRLKTGVDLLTEEAGNNMVDASRVGAIGWCMGGQQSLLLSLADPRIKATAIFYGGLVTDPDKLKALQGPVLGVFGNNDKAPSPEDVTKFDEALKKAGIKDVTIYRYDGVGHAFASRAAAKMGAYNEEKAKDAWAKTWAWLDAKLLKK
jgi:carboxymethylenebutenolidase